MSPPHSCDFIFPAGHLEFAAFPFAPVTPIRYEPSSQEPVSSPTTSTEPFPSFDPSVTAHAYEIVTLSENTIPIQSGSHIPHQSNVQTISEPSSRLIPSVAASARPMHVGELLDRLDFGLDYGMLRTQSAILNARPPPSDYATIVFPGFPALPNSPSLPVRSPADFNFPKRTVLSHPSRASNITRAIADPILHGGRVILNIYYEQPDGRLRRLSSVGSLLPYIVRPAHVIPTVSQPDEPLRSHFSDSSSSYVSSVASHVPLPLGILPSPSPSISSYDSYLSFLERLQELESPVEQSSVASSPLLCSLLSSSNFFPLDELVSPLSPSFDELDVGSPPSPLTQFSPFSFSTNSSDHFHVKPRSSFYFPSDARNALSRPESMSSVGPAPVSRVRKVLRFGRVIYRKVMQKGL